MRNEGWEELISKVIKICNKHDIDVSDMDALYTQKKKPRQHSSTSNVKATKSSNFFIGKHQFVIKRLYI